MENIFTVLFVVGMILISIFKPDKKEASKKRATAPEPYDNEPWEVPEAEAEMPCETTVADRPRTPRRETYTPAKPIQAPPTSAPPTETEPSEYAIRNAEEARRAIVWAEILRRKEYLF